MRWPLSILIVALILPVAPALGAENTSLRSALESIRTDQLSRHIDVLADDTLEGREAGSRGGRAASSYIRQQLAGFKLQPAGDRGSWFQSFHGSFRNILAKLPGSDADLAGEIVVVGAHYDHVGYGTASNSYGPTGFIHNGADDNASGVAGLLEVAEALAAVSPPPRRTILFALWDGEEKGLLGSKHWVSHSSLPKSRVALAVNLDMIGRLRKGQVEVFGTRSSWGLRRRISSSAQDADLSLNFVWKLESNSDHWSFFDRSVPVVMFHTGLHNDYHRPSDDVEKLNKEGVRLVSTMLFRFVLDAANADKLNGFRRLARHETPSSRRRLEQPVAPLPSRFGITWKKVDAEPFELRLSRVVFGSPAARAGLRAGDRLVSFDGQPISDGDQLRSLVLSAPSNVAVQVRRDGAEQPLSVDVQLDGRPVRIGIAWRQDDAEPGTVLLTRVVPGSPAALAGLRIRDRIYRIAGEDFADSDEFLARITTLPNPIALLVERNGKLSEVELMLAEMNAE